LIQQASSSQGHHRTLCRLSPPVMASWYQQICFKNLPWMGMSLSRMCGCPWTPACQICTPQRQHLSDLHMNCRRRACVYCGVRGGGGQLHQIVQPLSHGAFSLGWMLSRLFGHSETCMRPADADLANCRKTNYRKTIRQCCTQHIPFRRAPSSSGGRTPGTPPTGTFCTVRGSLLEGAALAGPHDPLLSQALHLLPLAHPQQNLQTPDFIPSHHGGFLFSNK